MLAVDKRYSIMELISINHIFLYIEYGLSHISQAGAKVSGQATSPIIEGGERLALGRLDLSWGYDCEPKAWRLLLQCSQWHANGRGIARGC